MYPLRGALEGGGPWKLRLSGPTPSNGWVMDLPASLSPSAILTTGTLEILCTWVSGSKEFSHPTVGMYGWMGCGWGIATVHLTRYLTVSWLRSHHTVHTVEFTPSQRWQQWFRQQHFQQFLYSVLCIRTLYSLFCEFYVHDFFILWNYPFQIEWPYCVDRWSLHLYFHNPSKSVHM